MSTPTHTNRLINESSPYLLQHAHNPVDWYPWGEEALAKAKEEDKIILVSIGYAACHWCHVMEHESFEDEEVAALMNKHFVCIKVDREERPDIDQIYMDACQIIRNSGGWPLNAFALPDGRPLDAMTYLPKPSWIKVLEFFANYYPAEKEKAMERAKLITEGVQQLELSPTHDEINDQWSADDLKSSFENWSYSFDYQNGGRKGAPKFPMPSTIQMIATFSALQKEPDAQDQLNIVLTKMGNGGIYDWLGGGFARYSVDDHWFVPHFEKMLYDNAQLISAYAEAFQITQDKFFLKIAEETVAFCKRELKDDYGGFHASLDADSEGEEGKFYVWTIEEIEAILPESRIFKELFAIDYNGNWENGKNILARAMPDKEAVELFDLSESQVQNYLKDSKSRLFSKRSERIHPGLDDKVLTAWNAMLISGLTALYRASEQEQYLEEALEIAAFLQQKQLSQNGQLFRVFKNDKSTVNAYLDDYAWVIKAWIDLYEVTFDGSWLGEALTMQNHVFEHFSDPNSPFFFYTSDLDPALAARKKESSDNVIPSSNSVVAENLWRLGHLKFQDPWLEQSRKMVNGLKEQVMKYPGFYANWARLAVIQSNPFYEVAICGKDAHKLRKQLQGTYSADRVFLGSTEDGSDLELLKGKFRPNETLIYVCVDKACKYPTHLPEEALSQMQV